MSKHTPGPWVVTPHPGTNVDVFGVGEIMDDKRMQYALSHTTCYQNSEANARLIAASPDLYEAVAAVIDATRDYLPPDGITKDEFISRVISATDNARMAEVMK